MRAGSEVLCEQQLKVARMRAVSPATVRAEQFAPGEGGGEAGDYVRKKVLRKVNHFKVLKKRN